MDDLNLLIKLNLLIPNSSANFVILKFSDMFLSIAEAVAVLNDVLGKDVKYIAVSDEDAIKAMTEMKFPGFLISLMIDLNQCIREGFTEKTTTTVKNVTGNDAISFEQFVLDNKGAWL